MGVICASIKISDGGLRSPSVPQPATVTFWLIFRLALFPAYLTTETRGFVFFLLVALIATTGSRNHSEMSSDLRLFENPGWLTIFVTLNSRPPCSSAFGFLMLRRLQNTLISDSLGFGTPQCAYLDSSQERSGGGVGVGLNKSLQFALINIDLSIKLTAVNITFSAIRDPPQPWKNEFLEPLKWILTSQGYEFMEGTGVPFTISVGEVQAAGWRSTIMKSAASSCGKR